MKDSFLLVFLYKTIPGRLLLRLLVQPGISRVAGRFLSSGASRWIVPLYIRKNKINMDDIEIPPGGFSSFNAFFIRKRKSDARTAAENCLVSPCDGYLTPLRVQDNMIFHIKNTEFSLAELLKDHRLAQKYAGGWALIFRLTPANYHRYNYAAGGKILCWRKIPGKLHCVRPVALASSPVFVQNSREYQIIQTSHFGTIVQMEIGALLVGKIRNRQVTPGRSLVKAGQEKGYFEFGGSTILLLLPRDSIRLPKEFDGRIKGSKEIPVKKKECVSDAVRI